MRIALVMLIGLAMSASVSGAESAPSEQVLADMGLSGLHILSDTEAANIRGMGFNGLDGFDGFKELHLGIRDFHKQVKAFHLEVKDFHKQVKKFDRKLHKFHHFKPRDMKPPKMSHGGKPW